MATRTPLYYNGSQLQEMKSSDLTALYQLFAYYYAQTPTSTLAVSGSGGNLTSINDTRLQAGAASTSSSAFPSEATTAEPSTVTTAYQRMTSTIGSAVTTTTDSGKSFPIYWTGTQIRHMTEIDVLDTFVYPTINVLASASTTAGAAGTYHIATSTSVTGSTLVSSTPVFTDTRADTSLYTASGIGETQDQPQNVTNYYLHVVDGVIPSSYNPPLYADSNNNLKQYSGAEIGTVIGAFISDQVATSTTGYKLTYNIDGSGTARGSAIVNTILTGGSGNYQTLAVSGNDYRAQEFPDGTPATANTYVFKILKS